jgi:hypothetical protein
MSSRFKGQKIAFLTQHGKETVLKPALDFALGCDVQHVASFDTDLLGTFTRDVERGGSQLEAARKKARKGMELSGLSIGVASEGSFGPDPFTGMLTWNTEQVMLIDDERGLEVTGSSQMVARCGELFTDSWEEASVFVVSQGFPSHQMVVRSQKKNVTTFYKGIYDWATLEARFKEAQKASKEGKVWMESDLRAFANPTRMENIRRATLDLVKRLKSECPTCSMPGFWRSETLPGLPCKVCGAPTHLPRGEVWKCVWCTHTDSTFRPSTETAEPKYCQICNP